MPTPIAVKIIFLGMVALIPKFNTDTPSSPNELTVLLPDADHHGYTSDGCNLARHFPILVVEGKNCRVGDQGEPCPGWRSSLPLREPSIQGGGYIAGAWMLRRRQVELSLQSVNPPKFELTQPRLSVRHGWALGGVKFPRNRDEARSSAWIPTPPVASDVREECLVGADCSITARMKLSTGRLRTCHLAQLIDVNEVGGGGYPEIWPFRFGQLGWSQSHTWLYAPFGGRAIADASSVAIFDVKAQSTVEIVLRRLDRPRKSVRIQVDYDPSNPVRIWIGNIADPDSVHSHGHCHSSDMDTHFETYYDLTSKSPSGEDINLGKRRVPRRSGRAMYSRSEAGTPTYIWIERFQESCPLLIWGVPDGFGPQNGDLSVCGQFQGNPPRGVK